MIQLQIKRHGQTVLDEAISLSKDWSIDKDLNDGTLTGQGQSDQKCHISYASHDGRRLTLSLTLDGFLTIKDADMGDSKGSIGFYAPERIINKSNMVARKLYLGTKQFWNKGFLGLRSYAFNMNSGLNTGIMHGQYCENTYIPEVYAVHGKYLEPIKDDVPKEYIHKDKSFQNHGVFLSPGTLTIKSLTYEEHGVGNIETMNFQDNAGYEVFNKAYLVMQEAQGYAHKVHLHHGGYSGIGHLHKDFKIGSWDNDGGLAYLSSPSTVAFLKRLNNQKGAIYCEGDLNILSKARPKAAGLLLSGGYINILLEKAQKQAGQKLDREQENDQTFEGEFFAQSRQVNIRKFIDHYLNKIIIYRDQLGMIAHAKETGHIFQRRTIQDIEIQVPGFDEKIQNFAHSIKSSYQTLTERYRLLLKALQNSQKAVHRHNDIIERLSMAFMDINLNDEVLENIFNNGDFQSLLSFMADEGDHEAIQMLKRDWVKSLATKFMDAKKDDTFSHYVKNNTKDIIHATIDAITIAAHVIYDPKVERVDLLAQAYQAMNKIKPKPAKEPENPGVLYKMHYLISDKNKATKDHDLWSRSGVNPSTYTLNKMLLPTHKGQWNPNKHSTYQKKAFDSISGNLAKQMDNILDEGKEQDWTKKQYKQELDQLLNNQRKLLKKGKIKVNKYFRLWLHQKDKR